MIDPIMGMNPATSADPADALFSAVRRRVLAPLFTQPERSFYVNELVRLAESGSGAVQRELESLARSGLVRVSRQGNQKHYQANPDSPIFRELRGIVVKTAGYAERLRVALIPLQAQIAWAALYGSAARGQMSAASDLDLLVVSDQLRLEDLFQQLALPEQEIGRAIHPTLYTRAEFGRRLQAGNSFLTKVLAGELMTLSGSRDAAG
ncbi:transcriptional regulator [Stagnimonas aquatica]|uniref:Transcriptional regulator n=2 Tax=Stagnimonas aquatica TaxID=2689987 RepID=A0A3N0V8W2_9GAMM|nr:transcriptional regulator [Stagnimonas aquatica]